MPRRRSSRARLIVILAALASLILGYYLGQYWQRRPLQDLSAVVYKDGKAVDLPAAMLSPGDGDADHWRLFLSIDTRVDDCRQLLRHLVLIRNRLGGWPDIQARLRPTLLAYDQPDDAAATAFLSGQDWVELYADEPPELDTLSAQLGILPDPQAWCTPAQANGILVAPGGQRWALIPHEQAAIMANNIAAIIQFVE